MVAPVVGQPARIRLVIDVEIPYRFPKLAQRIFREVVRPEQSGVDVELEAEHHGPRLARLQILEVRHRARGPREQVGSRAEAPSFAKAGPESQRAGGRAGDDEEQRDLPAL